MLKLHIELGNDAFGETTQERNAELARILRDAADRLEAMRYVDRLRDINGNTVGRLSLEVAS